MGDPLASTISYTHTFGIFTVTPSGCPMKYSFAIKDKFNAAVSPSFASLSSLVPDTYVNVIVGPSTDATLPANSPYILSLYGQL